MAYEYHWYLRREFRSALEATYRSPDSAKTRDPTWLSKLLAVLALGESFNRYEPPLIDLTQAADHTSCLAQAEATRDSYLPGARFFDQALSLFKMPSEEPEIEHVEALNLIVSIATKQLTQYLMRISHSIVIP
jgi:proline utilization trans-activator